MGNVMCWLIATSTWLETHEAALTVIAATITAIATGVIGWFTVALARSTKRLWIETQASSKIADKSATAALEMAKTMTVSERAYVKMSHTPPGLVFADPPSSLFQVHIEAKNLGLTPATITDVVVTSKTLPVNGSLPTIPDYPAPREHPLNIFLYKDDPFFTWPTFPIETQDADAIKSDTKHWFVYGYVDYIDTFGKRHRSGYARVYNSRADELGNYWSQETFLDRSNLFFVTQPGYNYDRPRVRGEGNDWD